MMSLLTRIICVLLSLLYLTNGQASSSYISTMYCSNDSVSSLSIVAGETVYYRIITTEEWIVTVDNCATSWDSQMRILDENENDISTGLYCDGDDCSSCSLRETITMPLSVGTYYVALNAYSASSTGPYQIDLSCAKISTQGTISCGQTISGSITDPLDTHYYQLELVSPQVITINDCNSAFNPTLLILNKNYQDITSGTYCTGGTSTANDCNIGSTCSADTDAEYFEVDSLMDGMYFVEISPYNHAGTGSYNIDLQCAESNLCCGCTADLSGSGITGCPSDIQCQNIICTDDSWCCSNEWDTLCANAAIATCSTAEPTNNPTIRPSFEPTSNPTEQPSIPAPTNDPSTQPTPDPTREPSAVPTTTDLCCKCKIDYSGASNPGCFADLTCQNNYVCPQDSYCCTRDWDSECIRIASDICNTVSPTNGPSTTPTIVPSADPTSDPSYYPSIPPTTDPTGNPTSPSNEPTNIPTEDPTKYPTIDPTSQPTGNPSRNPTALPTADPTIYPIFEPTTYPSINPTRDPSVDPTFYPIFDPTNDPTTKPTSDPTFAPSWNPTSDPTARPVKISINDNIPGSDNDNNTGDGETGNGNNLDESEQADNIDETVGAASANEGTFSTSVFGQFTDLIIFALLGVILCCILACCFIFCMVRKKKKHLKDEQGIAMGSMSPGEIADEKEGHAGPGTIRRAVTSPISYADQQMMTPNSTSGTPNVFRLHTNAQMNMMGYNQQNHFPFGGMTRLDSLSSTHGNSYGYGIGVVPSSPPNYPHPTVQAIMGTNGVGSPSLRDLNTIPAANPQYPQQQSSSSQHGQQGINIVNNCATPGNYQDYKQDDEYEYYEEQNEVDDPLEENEYDAMYEEPNINNATPGVAQVLANQIKLPPVDEEYYDEDEYYEDEPYGGL